MISLRQLQVFVAIAKTGNVTQAAESLYLSQSAASMALNELEKQLDTLLFDRFGKRLMINSNGKKLLGKATQLLDQASSIKQLFNETEIQGQLEIGASYTTGNYLLPKHMVQFKKQFPAIDLTLSIDNTQAIIEQVLDFNLDMGFIEGLCSHRELEIVPFYQDRLVIFARKNHQLSKKDKITYADLSKYQWVIREPGSGTRQFTEVALLDKVPNINIFLQLNHNEAIKQVVQTSDAVSCLSTLCLLKMDRQKFIILNTPPLKLIRPFYYVIHKNKFRSSILKKWINIFTNLSEE